MPVRARAFGVHHAFRDAFPVEVRHFLEKQEIFKNDWPAGPHRKRILIVAHGPACVRRHNLFFFRHNSSSVCLQHQPLGPESYRLLKKYAPCGYTSNI
jgi:hypothetical protein